MFSSRSYFAFISYAHANKRYARSLQRRLEAFKVHKPVEGNSALIGEGRLGLIFQDEAELGAAADLGEVLRSALEASQNLIVICSPASAKSHWVNEEILHFRRAWIERRYAGTAGGENTAGGRILAVVLNGGPASSESEVAEAVLPAAMREGNSMEGPETIVMAGSKPSDTDFVTRLVAHMLDVPFAALAKDRTNRRTEITKILAVGALCLALFVAFSEPLGRWYLEFAMNLPWMR